MINISLCILKTWLSDYSPILTTERNCSDQVCSKDCLHIREARLFHGEECSDISTVYVGRACDFGQSDSQNVICRYTNSILCLDSTDLVGVFNYILEAFSYYGKWANDLSHIIEQNGTLTELLDLSHEIFQNPILVLDSSDFLMACSSAYQDTYVNESWNSVMQNGFTLQSEAMQFHQSDKHIFDPHKKEPYFLEKGIFQSDTLSHNIFRNNEWCGLIGLGAYDHPFDKGYVHLFKILSDHIQLWADKQNSDHLFHMNETLLYDLLSGEAEKEVYFQQKLERMGWERKDTFKVILARTENDTNSTQSYLCRQFNAYSSNLLSVQLNQEIVLFVNTSKQNPDALRAYISPWLKKGDYSYGISYELNDTRDIPVGYLQAKKALDYGRPPVGEGFHIKDCASEWMLDEMRAHIRPEMTPPELKQLHLYDEQHGTDYIRTLFIFLKNERNILTSATELSIHRNTLYQRIDRLVHYFNIDLKNADARFYLLLCLYLSEGLTRKC